MKTRILLATLLTVGLGTSAFAFEQEGVKEGNSRLALAASFYRSSYDDSDSEPSTLYIYGNYSVFFTDEIEIGVGLSYSQTDPDAGDQDITRNSTIYPFINYNFDISSPTLVPYVGAGLAFYGTESGGETDTNFGWNAEGGLKMFITEMAAVTPALFYQDNGDFGDQLGVKFGVEIYF